MNDKTVKLLIHSYQNQLHAIIEFLSETCNSGFSRSIVGNLSIEIMLSFFSTLRHQLLSDTSTISDNQSNDYTNNGFSDIIEGRLSLLRDVLDLFCNLATRHVVNQKRLFYGLFQYLQAALEATEGLNNNSISFQGIESNEMNLKAFLSLLIKLNDDMNSLSRVQPRDYTISIEDYINEEQDIVMTLFWNLFPLLSVNRDVVETKLFSNNKRKDITEVAPIGKTSTMEDIVSAFFAIIRKVKATSDRSTREHNIRLSQDQSNISKPSNGSIGAAGCLASFLSQLSICTRNVDEKMNEYLLIQNVIDTTITDEHIAYFVRQLLTEIEAIYHDNAENKIDNDINSTEKSHRENDEESTVMTEDFDQMSNSCSYTSNPESLNKSNQKKFFQQNKFDDILECIHAIQNLINFRSKTVGKSGKTLVDEVIHVLPPQFHSVFYLLLEAKTRN